MRVIELYRTDTKPMANGQVRLDSLGRYMLDYAQGNFAGNPRTAVTMAYAAIPDEDGNDEQGNAELVHFAGWAYYRPVFIWHAQLQSGYALMMGVGNRTADATWFSGTEATPAPAGGTVDEQQLRTIVREEVTALLSNLPTQVVRAILDTPNAPDHYGLPEKLQSSRELQESLTYPILQSIRVTLTDQDFLKNELFPAWDQAAKG